MTNTANAISTITETSTAISDISTPTTNNVRNDNSLASNASKINGRSIFEIFNSVAFSILMSIVTVRALIVDCIDTASKRDNIQHYELIFDAGIQFIKQWKILIILLMIFSLIVSVCVALQLAFICMYNVLYCLYSLLFASAVNREVRFENRHEKIVLLDPLAQYSRLYQTFEDDLILYTTTFDRFREVTSNHLNDYALFLSFATFQDQLSRWNRLWNVSLCIFHEDNERPHPQIHIDYRIRFIFSSDCLEEYLRHVVALNCAKEARIYRRQGFEREADENFLAASRQYRILTDYLEQQSGTRNGREPEELPSNVHATVDDLNLPASTLA